jgi:hypothetical protein
MKEPEIPDDMTIAALVHWAERVGCKVTIKLDPKDTGAEREESSILAVSVPLTAREQLRKDVDTFRTWKKEKAGKLTCKCGKEYRSYNGLRLHSKKCAKGGVAPP